MFINEAIEAWHAKGALQRLNGHQVFCIDEGSENRQAILLIHGFPTSSYDFQAIWQTVGKHYRLLSIDLLGFGFSDKPNRKRYTIHSQADLIEAFIRNSGLKSYHILAHDYGVTVAQELLARNLEGSGQGTPLSCCFLNGGLFPETHRSLLTQKLLLGPLGKLITQVYSNQDRFERSFCSVFGTETKPNKREISEFWEIINYKEGRHLLHNLITYIHDRRDYRSRWVSALQDSKVPLSLINGSADPVSGKHLVDRYKELNCRLDHLCELAEIGHYPHLEAPTKVSSAYLSFVANV